MDTIVSYQMLNKNITFYSENSDSVTICFHIMMILRQDYYLTKYRNILRYKMVQRIKYRNVMKIIMI